MQESNKKRNIREMLQYIEKRPGMYLGINEKRLDYVCYFIDGWLLNNDYGINSKYYKGIDQWIYDWCITNKYELVIDTAIYRPIYKTIYKVTQNEEDACELFFKLSYEFLDLLEKEEN